MTQLTIAQFLSAASNPSWFTEYPVIYFKGTQQCPVLFFSMLNEQLKRVGVSIEYIPDDIAESVLRAKLHTSFLGMNTYYWLSTARMADKEYGVFLHELAAYKGPNTIGLYVPDAVSFSPHEAHCVVTLPTTIDKKMFMHCLPFFGKKTITLAVVNKVFAGTSQLSFDNACLMMHYLGVLGMQIDTFVAEWLPKIVPQESSLFTLSTHFFGKKPQSFFALWNDIQNEYAEVFWLTYWSEQLWRAHHFIDLNNKKQHSDAKKVSVRLPFSLIQRDWRQFSLAELKNAHNYLYALDYDLKNGRNPVGIQIFYTKFFTGEFR